MAGFVFALIAASLFGILEAEKKKATDYYGIKTIFWALVTFAAPVFALLLWANGIPEIDSRFWLVVAIDTPLLIFTNILFIRAEKISPISTTLPLLSFTPVFLIGTSFLLLGELPGTYGLIGIFLVVLGALLLKGEDLRKRLRHPIKSILQDTGAKYMLIIALIWSFNANFSKLGIELSSVWFYLFVSHALEALFMNAWMFTKHRKDFRSLIKGRVALLLSAALTNVLAVYFFMLALERTLVAYVIAMKRAGFLLGGVVLGALVFKERHIAYRIGGALIMLTGVIFILLLH